MNKGEFLFQGNVEVYLQGKNALLPENSNGGNPMTYYIASASSAIHIEDHRKKSNEAARKILDGQNGLKFTDYFNKPAWIKVRILEEGINIEMHECQVEGDLPTLWMGVIYDDKMPIYPIEWEILKPVGSRQTAFAALINESKASASPKQVAQRRLNRK